VRAADFLNEIGNLMAPDQWSASCIESLNSKKNFDRSVRETALFVTNQLIEAARIGIAQAEVWITEEQKDELFSTARENTDDISDADALFDAADGENTDNISKVNTSFDTLLE
jgi:uncharacterized protein YdaT